MKQGRYCIQFSPYTFDDNISIKGHMQGKALGVIKGDVFLDKIASGDAVFHSKKPSCESDVLQINILKEVSQ